MSTIRTYRAATFREALALVRAELGDEALVLGQRELRRRRFPWLRTIVETEVTAAVGPGTERIAASGRRRTPLASERRGGSRTDNLAASTRPAESPSGGNRLAQAAPMASPDAEHQFRPALLSSAPPSPPVSFSTRSGDVRPFLPAPPPCDLSDPFRLYTHLIEQDVEETDARELVSRLSLRPEDALLAEPELRERLRRLIAEFLPCHGPIRVDDRRRRVAALVGPTGVGKTTTIAKLAANFRLRDRRRVGLITVDTYRVAAIDQLRTYAQLIDVPLRVVAAPREMPQALDDLSDRDLVLIDTAGRSPQDDLRIQELRSFLQAAQADEVHLVLSLAAGSRNLALAAERFHRVGPTAVLLTKLDEAGASGVVLSAARRAELPLSYVTTGQDVPDDIDMATPDWLVQRLLRPPGGVAGPTAASPCEDTLCPQRFPLRTTRGNDFSD
jgi:flagellar biosynthesis protein FlhF